jgi:hypothetical protein
MSPCARKTRRRRRCRESAPIEMRRKGSCLRRSSKSMETMLTRLRIALCIHRGLVFALEGDHVACVIIESEVMAFGIYRSCVSFVHEFHRVCEQLMAHRASCFLRFTGQSTSFNIETEDNMLSVDDHHRECLRLLSGTGSIPVRHGAERKLRRHSLGSMARMQWRLGLGRVSGDPTHQHTHDGIIWKLNNSFR